jgi:hypothetical protein
MLAQLVSSTRILPTAAQKLLLIRDNHLLPAIDVARSDDIARRRVVTSARSNAFVVFGNNFSRVFLRFSSYSIFRHCEVVDVARYVYTNIVVGVVVDCTIPAARARRCNALAAALSGWF